MLTFIRNMAGHLAMVLGILCVVCFVNALIMDNSMGKGVYSATVYVSIFLQFVVGINIYCLLEVSDETPLEKVIGLNNMNKFLIFFIALSLLTLSYTYNAYFLFALLPIAMNAYLGFRICKQFKESHQKG